MIIVTAMVYDLAVKQGAISKNNPGYRRFEYHPILGTPKPSQPSGWYQKFNKRKNK